MSSDCAHHQVRRVRLRIHRRRAHGQERDADGEQAANRARELGCGDRGSPRTASSAQRRVWRGEAGARTLDGGGTRSRSRRCRTLLAAAAAAEGEADGAADGGTGAAASHTASRRDRISRSRSRRDRVPPPPFTPHGSARAGKLGLFLSAFSCMSHVFRRAELTDNTLGRQSSQAKFTGPRL